MYLNNILHGASLGINTSAAPRDGDIEPLQKDPHLAGDAGDYLGNQTCLGNPTENVFEWEKHL